jgi:hypothetical protein
MNRGYITYDTSRAVHTVYIHIAKSCGIIQTCPYNKILCTHRKTDREREAET